MRVLLIACTYPPDSYVGAFRAANIARVFMEAGHEVDVVTSRMPGEKSKLRHEEDRLRVHVVQELAGPRSLYRMGKRFFTRVLKSSSPLESGDEAVPAPFRNGERNVPRWKRYLLSVICVPDDRQGFILAAWWRSIPLLRRGVDLVYTTAPPFSDHLVGLVVNRTAGVRWVAEFRDPWTDNDNKPPHIRSRLMDALNRSLERWCMRHANLFVAVSEGTANLLKGKLPTGSHDRVLLALNGIDNLKSAGEAEVRSDAPFRIVYLGECYGVRDPRPLLRAVAKVAERRRLGPVDLRIEFIGRCRHYYAESLEQFATELGIGELVHFSDWLPQEVARSRAENADLFLLPFPGRRGIIPNKLYDYLGFRKPILAMVDPDGELARMLRRLGGHYLVAENDQQAAERAIARALDQRGEVTYAKEGESLLRKWTTAEQLRRLVKEIETV